MGRWSRQTIAGHDADVFEPIQAAQHRPAVIFLHGYHLPSLADNDAFTAEFERHGLRAVCPHGEQCCWLDSVCPEWDPVRSPVNYVRRDVTAWIEAEWGVQPPLIGLLGVSFGGQGVLQIGYRFGREFPVVVAISPTVDFHEWHGRGFSFDRMFPDQETARQATVTLQLHPLNWPRNQLLLCDPQDAFCYPGTERLASKLSSSGIPFESEFRITAGGHGWPYFNRVAPRAVEYLASSLLAASLRIV